MRWKPWQARCNKDKQVEADKTMSINHQKEHPKVQRKKGKNKK